MLNQLLSALSGRAPQASEIKAKLENGAMLIDVRTPAEYAANRVVSAQNVPLDQLDRFAQQQGDKQSPIVVHCLSGGRANQAVNFLKSQGFTDVSNAGGLSQIRQLLA